MAQTITSTINHCSNVYYVIKTVAHSVTIEILDEYLIENLIVILKRLMGPVISLRSLGGIWQSWHSVLTCFPP